MQYHKVPKGVDSNLIESKDFGSFEMGDLARGGVRLKITAEDRSRWKSIIDNLLSETRDGKDSDLSVVVYGCETWKGRGRKRETG